MWIWCAMRRAMATVRVAVLCHTIKRPISWAPCHLNDHQSMFFYGKSHILLLILFPISSEYKLKSSIHSINSNRSLNCVVYFRRVEEAKWKHSCKSIAAMLCKRWKPCYRVMMPCIRYQCQLRHHHFQWNPHFRHSFRRPYLVRRQPIDTQFFTNNSSTPNDFWPHHTRAPAICRQSYNRMAIKMSRMATAIDVAALANHRNDIKICNGPRTAEERKSRRCSETWNNFDVKLCEVKTLKQCFVNSFHRITWNIILLLNVIIIILYMPDWMWAGDKANHNHLIR